jgi:cathepsin E
MYLIHGSFTSSVESYSLIAFLPFNQTLFTLTADAQILPQNLNVHFGGVFNNIYLIVQDNGQNSRAEFPVAFTFGMLALQRFYCVLDTGNQRIGFAQTSSTNANINLGSN